MIVVYYIAILIVFNKFQLATLASINNCRVLKGDVLLYHRRVKEDSTKRFRLNFISYPEILLDKHKFSVISCIMCKDLNIIKKEMKESECKIISGGVGYTFAKFAMSSTKHYGYDYDIKIYGQRNKYKWKFT
ncbi:hypothetical protein FQA39_LY14991 [Lamprigera yunnana]|nr:hypothetical protein FQA39_LY14991 [Lamprigera yunnana]